MAAPPPLMEELEEEILLRFPPNEPALLVNAALVCRRWHRFVSGPAFRRRFRELHRTPPMLGFVCNVLEEEAMRTARFVTSTRFSSPDAHLGRCRALDARHGRVLLWSSDGNALVVWDPITNERQKLPLPPRYGFRWTAAVVCAGAGTGTCNHLDCHRGSFLVVLLGSGSGKAFICTYSSDAVTWSDPITMEHDDYVHLMPSVLVGDALYFGIRARKSLLKYDLESHKMSLIGLPFTYYMCRHIALNGELGLAAVRESNLCIWKKAAGSGVDVGWTQHRVIQLDTLLPMKAIWSSPSVVGFADGGGVIFLAAGGLVLYRIDLKTCNATKVSMGGDIYIYSVVPYMSFYIPALGAAYADEG